MSNMIQKLFKPYIVKRKHGQCQVLIPLIELDDLCDQIIKETISKATWKQKDNPQQKKGVDYVY